MDGGEAGGLGCVPLLSEHRLESHTLLGSPTVETSALCVDRAVEHFETLGYKREQIKTIGITNQASRFVSSGIQLADE